VVNKNIASSPGPSSCLNSSPFRAMQDVLVGSGEALC
jgi:hypothetical protein